jgi:hypothetical protein
MHGCSDNYRTVARVMASIQAEAAQRIAVQLPRARTTMCQKRHDLACEAVGWNGGLGGNAAVFTMHQRLTAVLLRGRCQPIRDRVCLSRPALPPVSQAWSGRPTRGAQSSYPK